MKLLITSGIAMLSLLSISCSSHLSPASSAPVYDTASARSTSSQARVLITTGRMRIRVTDVKQATLRAKSIVKEHKGYLAGIDSSDDKSAYADLTLRIPQGALVSVMDGLATLGKITSRNVQVEDVTNRWIDLQAKVKVRMDGSLVETTMGRLILGELLPKAVPFAEINKVMRAQEK